VRIADLHAAVIQIPDDDKSLIDENHSRMEHLFTLALADPALFRQRRTGRTFSRPQ
jgi:hypothetical protein